MTETTRGILDTSVVIDHDQVDARLSPEESVRMYGRLFAAARAAGQSSCARLADLLIASTAAANGLPLYTRNPSDFSALRRILKIMKV
jgi:predicted nucleic acid-binding protein